MENGIMSQNSVCLFIRFYDGHGHILEILLHLIKAGTLAIVGKSYVRMRSTLIASLSVSPFLTNLKSV